MEPFNIIWAIQIMVLIALQPRLYKFTTLLEQRIYVHRLFICHLATINIFIGQKYES